MCIGRTGHMGCMDSCTQACVCPWACIRGYQQGATSALYAYSKGPEAIFMKTMVSDVFLLAPCIFFTVSTQWGGAQEACPHCTH